MDAIKRIFTVSVILGKQIVNLTISFPDQYPNNESPFFEFGGSTTIPEDIQTKLLKVLQDTATQHVKVGRSCIEPCIRHLFTSLQTLMV